VKNLEESTLGGYRPSIFPAKINIYIVLKITLIRITMSDLFGEV